MSTRDELVDLIDDAIEWAGQEDIALADHIADAILAAGYIKADSEEWAVRFAGPGGLPMIDAMHIPDRMAGSYVIADQYADDPTARTVRRMVGPWEVAE